MAKAVYGFIYVAHSQIKELNYQEGQQVFLQATAPTILVAFEIANIYINDWPGQLWFVEILDSLPVIAVEKELGGVPSRNFKLVKLLASSFLFGAKGEGVSLLLNRILTLNLAEVQHLASLFSPVSADIYAAAWNNWLVNTHNTPALRDADHTGTLAIGTGENASPIYSGFLVINDLLYKKARELAGDSAFACQNNESSEVLLNPLWNKACSVLLQAAMALGAEQYVPPNELNSLLAGWHFLTQS